MTKRDFLELLFLRRLFRNQLAFFGCGVSPNKHKHTTHTNTQQIETMETMETMETDKDKDKEEPFVAPTTVSTTFLGSKSLSARTRSTRARKGLSLEETADAPASQQKSESEGPFWFEAQRTLAVTDASGRKLLKCKGITSQERQRLRELIAAGAITPSFLRNVVHPSNDETSGTARLRAQDFALTNYLKGHPVITHVTRADGTTEIRDLQSDYDVQLSRDHRLLFDPFRRGTHLFYDLDGIAQSLCHTTVGQLSMLLFMERADFKAWVTEHEGAIREAMKAAARSKPAPAADGRRKRRRELTARPSAFVRGALCTRQMELQHIVTAAARRQRLGAPEKVEREQETNAKPVTETTQNTDDVCLGCHS